MESISTRIQKAMDLRRLRQADLVERTGINKGALSSYISGRYKPKQNNIYLLAKALDVNVEWLMGVDVEVTHFSEVSRPKKSAVRIPVLGRVAAGIPINAVEETIDWEEIPSEMVGSDEYFGLRIKGDSMSPRIMDGDTVIVRRQDDADTGDIVIAIVNGDDGVCKKLRKTDSGIMLISLNPAYDPMVFDHSDIDTIPVNIIGRVVELRGKM